MEVCMDFTGGRTVILVDPPMECTICGSVTACLVNRDGRTRCYNCDGARLDVRAALERELTREFARPE